MAETDYIRDTYGIPIYLGQWVTLTLGKKSFQGRILKATHYIHVQFDPTQPTHLYHPKDERITYHWPENTRCQDSTLPTRQP